MPSRFPFCFENTIEIQAPAAIAERYIIDHTLMQQWLNPNLRCEPVGEWSVEVGAKCRFMLNVPFWQPALDSQVVVRQPGLVVWEFQGFFEGSDRWECIPLDSDSGVKTRLINRFEFRIPNPVVAFGFKTFAAQWAKQDMQSQLVRIQQLAERQKP